MDDETEPLDEAYIPTVLHNGREYQQYALDEMQYFEPIDEFEIARLSHLHSVLMKVMNNRLIPPALSRPKKILELGVGTGNWALEVAKAYPECEVTAVDICPHLWPTEELPDNLILQVDDVNKKFTWPKNEFDLVHSQMMVGAVNKNRWPSYIKEIFRSLRRGGWAVMVEIYMMAQSDNGSMTDSHALRRWSKGYMSSIEGFKDPRAPLQLGRWMREAGFIVEQDPWPTALPTCGWSTDRAKRELGVENREHVRGMLSSVAMYPMTVFDGMASSDFEILVAQARNEADTPSLKPYFPLYVCRGQKPR